MEQLTIKQTNGVIEGDFETMKAYLHEQLDIYKTVVFTEESKKEAKNTVANLRKGKKELADSVKAVKTEWMKPFDTFNAQAKELMALYDEPIDYINSQIEEFEAKRKAERNEAIRQTYGEVVPESLREIIPLQRIFSTKWENATTTLKSIKAEMLDVVKKAETDLDTIKSFHSDMEDQAISMYQNLLDISAVVSAINNYENQKKEILEREREKARQEELRRMHDEARAEIMAEQAKEAEIAEAKAEVIDSLIPEEEDVEPEKITYVIDLTPKQKETLEMYMDSVGITYSELKF